MKITIRQLRRIIREAKKGQQSMEDIIRDHGPQRHFVDEDGAAYLKREARHSIKKFGGDYKSDEAEDDFYEWGEATDYDLYDLRVAWEAVVEEFEAEEEAREAAKKPSVPEWQTQEWYDETVEDYEDDSLKSLRHSESAFEDAVRRDARRMRDDGESRAILKIIRDLIDQKTSSKMDREDPTSRDAIKRVTRLRPGEKFVG